MEKNKQRRPGGRFANLLSRNGFHLFDLFVSGKFWLQLLGLSLIACLLFLVLYLIANALTGASQYQVFTQMLNPLERFAAEGHEPNNLLAAIITVFGAVFITGILITTLVNWVDSRKDRWGEGATRYNIRRDFIVIIGGHPMTAKLCRRLLSDTSLRYVIVMSSRDSEQLRNEINSALPADCRNRLLVYHGRRDSMADLSELNLHLARAIYILGEDAATDGNEHDTLSLSCFRLVDTLTHDAAAEGNRTKIPCRVMMVYNSTFKVFRFTDIVRADSIVDFMPFNINESWAQQVFAAGRIATRDDVTYEPLDTTDGIGYDSNRFVHLIVIGMTPAGTAMAVEAAHICHYPNYLRDRRLRTRITFIDPKAEVNMHYFTGRYRELFDLSRRRFVKVSETAPAHPAAFDPVFADAVTGWYDGLLSDATPYERATLGEDFVDVEWEFIEGVSAHPAVIDYLERAAAEPGAIVTVAVCHDVTAEACACAVSLPRGLTDSPQTLQVLVNQPTVDSIIDSISKSYVDQKGATNTSVFSKFRPFGMISDCMCDSGPDEVNHMLVEAVYSLTRWTDKPAEGEPADLSQLVADAASADSLRPFAAYWNRIANGSGKTMMANRWSDIYNAETIATKRRSFALTPSAAPLSYDNILTDRLARVEHNRWVMEQLLIGYRPLTAAESAALAEGRVSSRQLKAAMAHPAICDFDLLPFDLRNYDLSLSANLPVILEIDRLLYERGLTESING